MSTHLSDKWSRGSSSISRVSSSIVFTALIILGIISFNSVSGQPVQKTQGAEVNIFLFDYFLFKIMLLHLEIFLTVFYLVSYFFKFLGVIGDCPEMLGLR